MASAQLRLDTADGVELTLLNSEEVLHEASAVTSRPRSWARGQLGEWGWRHYISWTADDRGVFVTGDLA